MWLNPQETADLVTFTKEILNEKLHFLCSGNAWGKQEHLEIQSRQKEGSIHYLCQHRIIDWKTHIIRQKE